MAKPVIQYLTIGHSFTILIVRTIKVISRSLVLNQLIKISLLIALENVPECSPQSGIKGGANGYWGPLVLRYQGKFGVFGLLPKSGRLMLWRVVN